MKKILACLLLALMLVCAAALAEYEYEDGYRIITGADGKFGLENEAGEIVLQPVYDEIGSFAPWPDGVNRCWLIRDGRYGWYPAPGGGAAPCAMESRPELFSHYIICDDRIWNLNGEPANDALYARLKVISENRLAAWIFSGTKEKWDELYDSWGGRMDYAEKDAVILDEKLCEVFRLQCDFIEPASEGLCAFMDFDVDPSGEKFDAGYVDLNGNVACRRRTDLEPGSFDHGYARTFRNGPGGANLIGTDFEKVFEDDYDWITAFTNGHAVLCNRIWDGDELTGHRCTLVNDRLEEIMDFNIGLDVNGVWSNGRIIVNDGDYGLYYVHDMDKKLLLKGKYVGPYTGDDRVRYQNEQGRWGYISGDGSNVIPARFADARDFSGGFAGVQDEDGSWFFINTAGENAFGCSWAYIENFRDGYAYVRDAEGGYMINSEGKRVRPILERLHYVSDAYNPYVPAAQWDGKIEEIWAESHGMRIFRGSDGKFGVMDGENNILAPAVYDEVMPPDEAAPGIYRAVLKRDYRYGWCGSDGFCDAKWTHASEVLFAGLTIVSPETDDFLGSADAYYLVDANGNHTDNVAYDEINAIGGGLLALREKGSAITFVVDEDFRQVFSLECDEIDGYYGVKDGLCCFKRAELWGWCDLQGNVVIEPVSSMPSGFSDGHAVITRYNRRLGDEEYALINTRGETVIPFGEYKRIYGFENGYAILLVEDKSYSSNEGSGGVQPFHRYRVVDAQLNTLCEFTGNCHDNRSGDLILYYAGGDSILIDKQGREQLRAESISDWSYGLCRFQQGGLYGFMDENGEIILPARYADAGMFGSNGLCPVKESGSDSWKYINAAGETAFTAECDYAGDFGGDDYAVLDYEWYINEKGEIIGPFFTDGWW